MEMFSRDLPFLQVNYIVFALLQTHILSMRWKRFSNLCGVTLLTINVMEAIIDLQDRTFVEVIHIVRKIFKISGLSHAFERYSDKPEIIDAT